MSLQIPKALYEKIERIATECLSTFSEVLVDAIAEVLD